MKAPYRKTVPYPSYRAKVVYLYDPERTIEGFKPLLDKLPGLKKGEYAEEDWSTAMALTINCPEARRVYVLIGRQANLGDLAHECVHVTSHLFQGIDTTHTEATEENYAYTFTAVFEDLYRLVYKKTPGQFLKMVDRINDAS